MGETVRGVRANTSFRKFVFLDRGYILHSSIMSTNDQSSETQEIAEATYAHYDDALMYFYRCPKCGYDDILEEAKFCAGCGVRVNVNVRERPEPKDWY